MSAGLAASTVTPGRMPPVASLTTPASDDCAAATPGTMIATRRTAIRMRTIADLHEPCPGRESGKAIFRLRAYRVAVHTLGGAGVSIRYGSKRSQRQPFLYRQSKPPDGHGSPLSESTRE